MIRVLFVCTGNICRSPMAEAVFAQLVARAGLSDRIQADSAGTSSYHEGEAPHIGTMTVLRKRGIPYAHFSRPLSAGDMRNFDYLIALDSGHLTRLQSLVAAEMAASPEGTHRPTVGLLLDYAPETGVRDMPDPYFTGGFDEVYDLVLAGCNGLLAKIREEQPL